MTLETGIELQSSRRKYIAYPRARWSAEDGRGNSPVPGLKYEFEWYESYSELSSLKQVILELYYDEF